MSARRAELETELAAHGIRLKPAQQQVPGGSRFATRGNGDLAERLKRGEAQAISKGGNGDGFSAVQLLTDVRAAKAGDQHAHARLAGMGRQPSRLRRPSPAAAT